jgi:hypothetical protein
VEKRLGCGEKRRLRRQNELEKTEKIEGPGKWRDRRILQVILSDWLSLAKRNQKYLHFDDTNKLI